MTRMTENLPFCVEAVHPSGIPQYSGGKMTATRQFVVACNRAEELGLRALGKWRGANSTISYSTPQLPARYPYSPLSVAVPGAFPDLRPWPFNMVAVGFSITPKSECCFNNDWYTREEQQYHSNYIVDLENKDQAERYYSVVWDDDGNGGSGGNEALMTDTSCKCVVTVQYEEPPWDCTGPDQNSATANVDILENTAISVEKNSSYELYTLPNRNLIWADYSGADQQLKGDSYATIYVPTADIVVDWYNIPVARLCEIESHLAKFRNHVNCVPFTLLSECLCISSEEESCNGSDTSETQCQFEAETVLFLDWDEIKEHRTRGFRLMDTTTLRLNFKQKRIINSAPNDPTPEIVGHNHLYLDSNSENIAEGGWRRVERKHPGGNQPLYYRKNFNNMFDPEKDATEGCTSGQDGYT